MQRKTSGSEPDSAASADEVSKSQRKREALAVQSLAARLVALGGAQLRRIPLDETILGAVHEARGIRSNIARKRQLQFIAKLLRREEIDPIVEALESLSAEARQLTARHHRAEAWRDHLLARGDEALSELIRARPGIDPQPIRQCVRKSGIESRDGRPPAAARALFRLLRDLDQEQPLPVRGDDR